VSESPLDSHGLPLPNWLPKDDSCFYHIIQHIPKSTVSSHLPILYHARHSHRSPPGSSVYSLIEASATESCKHTKPSYNITILYLRSDSVKRLLHNSANVLLKSDRDRVPDSNGLCMSQYDLRKHGTIFLNETTQASGLISNWFNFDALSYVFCGKSAFHLLISWEGSAAGFGLCKYPLGPCVNRV